MRRLLFGILCLTLATTASLSAQTFALAPALAIEAEDFVVEKGWKVVVNGQGNSMTDGTGFNHISGERLLGIDAANRDASAYRDVTVPQAGEYRLWVRYEYPAQCETRFRVVVEQGEKTILDHLMGSRENLRYGFGDRQPRAQHDPATGSQGLVDEVVSVKLAAGQARIYLKGCPQPAQVGVAAPRHIDLVYLTSDAEDRWIAHYSKENSRYPLLDAFRDTMGPRYEVRFTNKSQTPSAFTISHVYNRVPFLSVSEGLVARDLPPGASSAWIGLKKQDTCHYGLVRFNSSAGAFEVVVRPVGDQNPTHARTLIGSKTAHLYLPIYPGKGESPVTPEEEMEAILHDLAASPAPGKKPTQPLCYGGGLPLGIDNAYGRKYAQLYAALGFRSLNPTLTGTRWKQNLEQAGVPLTRSWAITRYRNPPSAYYTELGQNSLLGNGLAPQLKWYDYGDEIVFSEWMKLLVQEQIDRAKERKEKLKPEIVVRALWREWLFRNRPTFHADDYWLQAWGPVNVLTVRPDSSAAAAAENPRLYVDSILFYEEISLAWVSNHASAVREVLDAPMTNSPMTNSPMTNKDGSFLGHWGIGHWGIGELGLAADNDDPGVLCGSSVSCQPFYYPSATATIRWFRSGAADMGRHTDSFWQAGQAGPLVNGYLAEHFRAGMRDNPRAVLRQYTMAASPANTEASFLRSCFTHLAHGARLLDFGPIGLNETGEETYIDHRDHDRFRSIRDVTHAVGLVEDLLPDTRPVPSSVALLVSESTERWDMAAVAQDVAGRDLVGPAFRKIRLNHHQDRLGLWQTLTLAGFPPDLILEEDLKASILDRYKVLVLVGDCLPPELAPVVAAWVKKGGVLLATANTGRYDKYRKPTSAWQELFGLTSRHSEERDTFFRPLQELPFLKPLDLIAAADWQMPQLGTYERIGVGKGVEVLAQFKEDDSPAFIRHRLGQGRVYYLAGQPGVASLWSALQPPQVPDRGPAAHAVPTQFNEGTNHLVATVLRTADLNPILETDLGLIDARVLKAPGGYVVPLANYNATVNQKVTLTLRLSRPVTRCVSAFQGEVPVQQGEGLIQITLPALGYGDLLRLTEK